MGNEGCSGPGVVLRNGWGQAVGAWSLQVNVRVARPSKVAPALLHSCYVIEVGGSLWLVLRKGGSRGRSLLKDHTSGALSSVSQLSCPQCLFAVLCW